MIIVICGVVGFPLSIKYVNFFYCVPKIISASKVLSDVICNPYLKYGGCLVGGQIAVLL